MPRYRFLLPVRAIGNYRLPDSEYSAPGIALTPAVAPAYIARIQNVQAQNVELAYKAAQELAETYFGYLALLGEDCAFILDGKEGLKARNMDLEDNPVPAEQPPPLFESIGGVISLAGQEALGALLDPEENKRRSGAIVIHDARGLVTPGMERLDEVSQLFNHRATAPDRVRIALGIIHDAACAREYANGFAQTFTALEVLTEHLRPPNVLDNFYNEANEQETVGMLPHNSKAALLDAVRGFLVNASLPEVQADRIRDYIAMTQSKSQVDVFGDYLSGLGIDIPRKDISEWRKLRGALVHAAAANDEQSSVMRRFREVVRAAVLEELRRATPPLEPEPATVQ